VATVGRPCPVRERARIAANPETRDRVSVDTREPRETGPTRRDGHSQPVRDRPQVVLFVLYKIKIIICLHCFEMV